VDIAAAANSGTSRDCAAGARPSQEGVIMNRIRSICRFLAGLP